MWRERGLPEHHHAGGDDDDVEAGEGAQDQVDGGPHLRPRQDRDAHHVARQAHEADLDWAEVLWEKKIILNDKYH